MIVIAWSITNASILLNLFYSGGQTLEWYILLLLFFVSVFAGMLLADIKAIVLGMFEAIFITLLLSYIGMILPIFVGGVSGYYEAQAVYTVSMTSIFRFFFPMVPLLSAIGALAGGFFEDWLF